MKIFFKEGGESYRPASRLVQADLAKTLEEDRGRRSGRLYKGEVAEAISRAVQADGGLITPADMAAYKVVERAPVKGSYRGYEIVSMPPPSSGAST